MHLKSYIYVNKTSNQRLVDLVSLVQYFLFPAFPGIEINFMDYN